MQKALVAPALDTLISLLLEYPIQTALYILFFQYFSRKQATAAISITTLIINFIGSIAANSYIYKKSVFNERKLFIQGCLNILSIIIIMPPIIYTLLYIFRNVKPKFRILLVITVSEIFGYIGKVFLTYFIWEFNMKKLSLQ